MLAFLDDLWEQCRSAVYELFQVHSMVETSLFKGEEEDKGRRRALHQFI